MIRQISLQRSLRKKSKIYENFGEKESRQLDEYIGDIWNYDFNERHDINRAVFYFDKWRGEYSIDSQEVKKQVL